MLAEIAVREQEIAQITDRPLATSADSMEAKIEELRVFVEREMKHLADLLNTNSPLAKQELHRRLKAVKMHPMGVGRSWYYEAEGSWNLLGTDERGLDLNQRPLGYEKKKRCND